MRDEARQLVILRGVALRTEAGLLEDEHRRQCDQDSDREADREGHQRAPGEPDLAVDEGHRQPGQRPELGSHHHRADDQDGLVEEDAHGGDLHRDDHEAHEGDRKLGLLARALLDLLPYHRIGGQAGGRLLRCDGGVGYRGVDMLDSDGAHGRDVELLEVADDQARLLTGDVAQDHVPLRLVGSAVKVDDVDDCRRGAEQVERVVRDVFRRDDAEVDHGAAAYR